MNKKFKQIKNLNLDIFFAIIDSGNYKCYDFYVKDNFDTFFQEVLQRDIKYETYRELEHKIVKFMKLLIAKNGIDNIQGYIGTDSKTLRNHSVAKCCKKHYKKMRMLGKRSMLGSRVRFVKEDIPVVLMMGVRGIARIVFIMEKLDLIVYISYLKGVIIFNENMNIDSIAEMAKQSGLEFDESIPLENEI